MGKIIQWFHGFQFILLYINKKKEKKRQDDRVMIRRNLKKEIFLLKTLFPRICEVHFSILWASVPLYAPLKFVPRFTSYHPLPFKPYYGLQKRREKEKKLKEI